MEEMEWSEAELVEHELLDAWIEELGIVENMMDKLVELDFNTEMRYLEGVLAKSELSDEMIMINQGWVLPDAVDDKMVEGPEYHHQFRVNTIAYHSLGTWFLNNWVQRTPPGMDMSPECGERNIHIIPKSINV